MNDSLGMNGFNGTELFCFLIISNIVEKKICKYSGIPTSSIEKPYIITILSLKIYL